MAKTKKCRHCGQTYTGFLCTCRRRSKRGGRARSVIAVGCGTRSWSLASARARMLGGWADDTDAGRCARCGAVLEYSSGEMRCPACFERASRSNNAETRLTDCLEERK